MRLLNISICALLGLLSQALPAQSYCGPGKATFPAPPALNGACQRHDQAYDKVPGAAKYLPGLGNQAVQQADRRLIGEALRSAPLAPRRSLAVAGYFAGKTALDAVGTAARRSAVPLGLAGARR